MKLIGYSDYLQFINKWIVYLILVEILNSFTETLPMCLAAEEDIHFEIIEPESLRYTYRARMAQNFGTNFERIYSNVNLMVVEPNDSCNTIVNRLELHHNIGLIKRGGCSFLAKCIVAQTNGMIAVIIDDNNDDNDDMYVEMVTDSTTRNCSIPAAFLLGKDGFMIRRALRAHRLSRAIVNIPINVSKSSFRVRHPPWVVW